MKYLIAACLLGMSVPGFAADQPGAKAPTPRLGQGYLKNAAPPESIILSPAPPAPGSVAQARDDEASRAGLALKDGPRWALATQDADLFSPRATATMSCALGADIGPQTTPRLDRLLHRVMADFGMSTSVIKRAYNRPRPFMVNGQPTCTPDWEPMLRKDGSYPSGHSAIGYGWGLILAELQPDNASRIVARGRAFGDSRRVCNVHWLSDIEEGRIAAAATFARLNAEPAFQKDMKAVRAELKRAKPAPQNCESEAAALRLAS